MRIFHTALMLSLLAAPAFARGPDSKVEDVTPPDAAAQQAWTKAHPTPAVKPAPDSTHTSSERR